MLGRVATTKHTKTSPSAISLVRLVVFRTYILPSIVIRDLCFLSPSFSTVYFMALNQMLNIHEIFRKSLEAHLSTQFILETVAPKKFEE